LHGREDPELAKEFIEAQQQDGASERYSYRLRGDVFRFADAYVDDPEAYQALEAVGVLEASYRKAGTQFTTAWTTTRSAFPASWRATTPPT
jgi:hypothetical protein